MDTGVSRTAGASAYGVWDRVKVSREFFDLLITHPVFQAEPKAVNTAQYWLLAIDAAMERNEDKPVPWHHKDIANRFQSFSQPYKAFRDALRELGLIDFGRYRPPSNAFNPGECREFIVTPLGQKLVLEGNHQWLYKLLKDPATWRRNQVAISKRGVRDKVYAEPQKQIVHSFITEVTFDGSVWERLDRDKVENFNKWRSGEHHVRELVEKKFSDLEIDHGRVYNDFVALPPEYRPFARHRRKPYIAMLDIRACHPTFLGEFLRDYYEAAVDEYKNRTAKTYPNPKALDQAEWLWKKINLLALMVEHNRWTEIFTHPTIDPRAAIMREAGLTIDLSDMKECLNTWLNGGKEYERRTDSQKNRTDMRALERWFQRSFPEMAKIWSVIPRKGTGCCISEEYEGPLMLDPALYTFAGELGLTLANEYDGVGVLGKPDDPELPAKLENLSLFIQRKSVERFDVAVVVKVKQVCSPLTQSGCLPLRRHNGGR